MQKMQVLPRWRNVLVLKNTIAQSTKTTSAAYFASIHSTDASFEKWKVKFTSDGRKDHQPSKNYVRYAVRQKRADTKKALKHLLFNSRGTKSGLEEAFSKIEADYADHLNKKSRVKGAHQARRAHPGKRKRNFRRENSSEDFDEYPESIFRATFGNRTFTYAFKPWEMGFDWKQYAGWNFRRQHEQDRESDDEPSFIGNHADREILGLPRVGPLKIEDVKSAFRLSALKWHPDKHQGPSQALAEEKFKLCVNAYNSLCSVLSTAED